MGVIVRRRRLSGAVVGPIIRLDGKEKLRYIKISLNIVFLL